MDEEPTPEEIRAIRREWRLLELRELWAAARRRQTLAGSWWREHPIIKRREK